ncbi:MAG: rRNA pseudouridine synthase [Sphingobacteriales bacterium]|nr:MAG: rRNA pseudouridine synthase [Sphingobacteriales bacterium]
MASQFICSDDLPLLGSLDFKFPEGTHAIGRLDLHSEGLLLLTTNKKITRLLFQGAIPHPRTYHVLVKHKVSEDTLEKLRTGVSFIAKQNKLHTSAPCDVEIVVKPPFNFTSPYIMNTYIDYTWLKMSLTEGRFHQVRKMVRLVGHSCVRLVRTGIGDIQLGDLAPGDVREMEEEEFFYQLKL